MENVYEEKLHLHCRNKSVRVDQQNQLHLLVTSALDGCGSPLNRRLGEPQSRCECIGMLLLSVIEPQFLGPTGAFLA